MTTWRVVFEYDGSAYSGWQRQPNVRSVQGTVEDALCEVLGGQRVPLIASGRTDAGVHAFGQLCSFRTTVDRKPTSIRDGLNSKLPDDIACLVAAPAQPEFHAQRSATGKLYRYVLRIGPVPSALRAGRYWGVRWPLDLDAMNEALVHLTGEHDFTSFRAAGCSARSPVRELRRADVHVLGDEMRFEFYGAGFLRHMVRNIVGSTLEVGRGRKPATWMAELRDARDRGLGGRTAPGCGLFLVRVDYPSELLSLG
ncbi:MAG: tRNA pseudouridine(38-40) synthase TruA [Proteobacteria bacterium]|nr:tRNA pseudouridine(38-40) synthase TruA [Pseudomonadota bacterium]